jgi:hypothetical protein
MLDTNSEMICLYICTTDMGLGRVGASQHMLSLMDFLGEKLKLEKDGPVKCSVSHYSSSPLCLLSLSSHCLSFRLQSVK